MPQCGGRSHLQEDVAAVRTDALALIEPRLVRRQKDGGATRPGALDSGPEPVDSPNAVSGKARAIEYQGTWVKITLEGASDEEFVVNMPDTEFFVDPINTGDMVRAHWKAADVHPLVGSNRSDRPHASGQN
jgi:hypothetical protein